MVSFLYGMKLGNVEFSMDRVVAAACDRNVELSRQVGTRIAEAHVGDHVLNHPAQSLRVSIQSIWINQGEPVL